MTGNDDVGLIAEEVEEILPEIVTYDEDDRPKSVRYDHLGVFLVREVERNRDRPDTVEADGDDHEERIEKVEANLNARDDRIADQADRIDELEAETDTLRAENEELRDENDRLREQNAELEDRLAAVEAKLGIDAIADQQGEADD